MSGAPDIERSFFDYHIEDEEFGVPSVEFKIRGYSPGKESVRESGGNFYIPTMTRKAMESIRFFLKNNMEEYGIKKHEGPVFFIITANYHWKKKKEIPMFHTDKPDIDNILKLVFDAVKKSGLIKDDNQIFEGRPAKRWKREGASLECKFVFF